MKMFVIQSTLTVLFCCLVTGQAVEVPPFEESTKPVTNADLVEMLKGELPETVIRAKISASTCRFDTSAAALNELKTAGASEELILLVLKTAHPSADIPAAQPKQPPAEPQQVQPAAAATAATAEPAVAPTQTQPRSEPPPYEPAQVYMDDDDIPKVEVFGGFSYARGDFDRNMYGWHFSVAGVFTPWFSVVGDFSGNYWAESYDLISVDASMYSFAGGPRFSGRSDAVTGFAHFLVGINRIGAGVNIFGANVSASESNLEFVSGGGLDINIGDHLAVRAVQGDWIHIRGNGGSANMGRISAGLVGRF